MQIWFSSTQNITSVLSLVMCEVLFMRDNYGGRFELKQMKIPTEIAYSLEMNEYEIGGDNFHGDKDVTGEDSDEFERDFYNEIDENGEILAEDEDGDENDIYRQLAQKEKDLLLAAELGKALLEKNEEISQKYELLQEEYSQVVEELEQDKYELRLKVERLQDGNDSRVHELQADLITLRNELKTLQSNSMNDKQSKRETFAGLTEENEQLHSDLQKAKTENEQLRRDLGLLNKQLSRKFSFDEDRLQQMEIDELSEKATRLEEENLSLTKTVSELGTSKETLSKEVEELLAKNQSLEKKLTSSKGQLAHCEEELNESKDLNAFLQEQIDEIKMQASMDQLSRTSLFSELSDLSVARLDDDDEDKDLESTTPKMMGARLRPVASLHGNPKPLQASSSLGLGLSSNKRHRPYSSVSDSETDGSDLEYDEDEIVDGDVARNRDFYAQLEEEEKANAQLKKEICEAHDELRALYEELRSSHASSDSFEVNELEPSSDFKPGCLTTFVKNFREVLEEMVRDNSTRTTNLKQQLCKAHENIDSLEEELVAVNSESKKMEEEVASLKEKLTEKDEEIEHIKQQRNKLAKGECESQLAFDIMYNEAVQERQDAVEREKNIAKELKQSKEDREELDHQLKEAIQQKIRLSKQLEDWQFDMASLIDDQVQKQMKSAAKEHDDNARRRRMSAFARTTRWHWNTGNTRRQNML
ncbi:uncharacterized protein LOC144647159 [Oculina patagonica]